MILEIWLALFIISGFLLYMGYRFDAMAGIALGFGFLFIVGIGLVSGVEYSTGSTIDQSVSPVVVEKTYNTYDNNIMGLLLNFISVLGASFAWMEFRKT